MLKKIAKVLILLGMICFLLLSSAAWAESGSCGENVTWKLDSEGLLTISGNGRMEDYYYLTPWNCARVKSVIIEQGVTEVGDYAFYSCSSLTSITLPSSVTDIGNATFYRCSSLTSITLPNSMTSIGDDTFAWCDNLTSITLPDSLTSIGDGAFRDCSSLTSINLPDSLTIIGGSAFYGCSSLTSITLPAGVTSIGDIAFTNCPATRYCDRNSLTASAMTKAGYNFKDMEYPLLSLKAYEDENGMRTLTVVDCDPSAVLIEFPDSVTSIGDYTFYGCSSLMSITIPDGVTSIGDYAFYDCSSLMSVTLPDGVASIGDNAFDGCSGLTSIAIPDSVISIGAYAFCQCTSLTSITLPESVTSIGNSVFYYCYAVRYCDRDSLTALTMTKAGYYFRDLEYPLLSLKVYEDENGTRTLTIIDCDPSAVLIEFPDGVTSIGDYAFSQCDNVTSITLPDSVTSIGDNAFSYCDNLTSITIPDGVTSLGDYAFYYCSGLTSIAIPDGVTSIGDNAFSGCPAVRCCDRDSLTALAMTKAGYYFKDLEYPLLSLKAYEDENGMRILTIMDCDPSAVLIEFPDGVTSIGDHAFYGCSGLTSIAIPDGVTSIGDHAFYGCSGLTSIMIPDSVTSIGDNAFYHCDNLTSITIPDGVTSLGDYAFYYCSGLTSIAIPDGVTSLGDYAFYYCSELTSITIPDGVTSIGDSAFAGCSSLTSLTIPDGVTGIGDSAFAGCSSLTSLTIPDGVTGIGDYVFSWCDNLTSITIPDGVTSLGDYAFCYCSELTSITIPDGVTSIGDFAFYYCSGLTSIMIPDSVTSIGDYAFQYCYSLTQAAFFNDGNMTFGSNLFSGELTVYCYKSSDVESWALEHGYLVVYLDTIPATGHSIYFKQDVCEIQAGKESAMITILSSCEHQIEWAIHISDNLTLISESNDSVVVSGDKPGVGTVSLVIDDVIPSSATCSIIIHAEKQHKLPGGLKKIDAEAFINLTAEEVVLGDWVESIGTRAFADCKALALINLPDGIQIADDAFDGCEKLTILCTEGSTGHAYAVAHGIPHIVLAESK